MMTLFEQQGSIYYNQGLKMSRVNAKNFRKFSHYLKYPAKHLISCLRMPTITTFS